MSKQRLLWIAVTLAFAAAGSYLLMAVDVLNTGDLAADEAPPGIAFVAAGGYALGGLLILVRRRWLWIVGAVLNAMIVAFFFAGYASRPAVLTSSGGIVSKVAEVLLEVALVALIVRSGAKAPQRSPADVPRPLQRVS